MDLTARVWAFQSSEQDCDDDNPLLFQTASAFNDTDGDSYTVSGTSSPLFVLETNCR